MADEAKSSRQQFPEEPTIDVPLSEHQLARLAEVLSHGSQQASKSMATWLSVPSLVEIDSLRVLPIGEAARMLGGPETTLCFCTLGIVGSLHGQIVLAFDDRSGLALANLLLDRANRTTDGWGELEQSAALETMNILGSAYLNALATQLEKSEPLELLPSPPTFRREFAASLLEAAFLDQATASNFILIAQTAFEIRGQSLDWQLLFIPDAASMVRLCELTS